MPAILEQRDYRRWLDADGLDSKDAGRPPVDLLRPFPAEEMRAWPVSDRVGNARNDEPQLLDEKSQLMDEQRPFADTLFPDL